MLGEPKFGGILWDNWPESFRSAKDVKARGKMKDFSRLKKYDSF